MIGFQPLLVFIPIVLSVSDLQKPRCLVPDGAVLSGSFPLTETSLTERKCRQRSSISVTGHRNGP